jgi:molybdopterin/thiamine biosynthesis adenylyltransferase
VFFVSRALNVPPFKAAGYSMWRLQAGSASVEPEGWGALPPGIAGLSAGLAGCGAVGTSWLHAVWATPGLRGEILIADPDPEGITQTNLNRYPLFGQADVGLAKAEAAQRSTRDMDVQIDPHTKRIEVVSSRPPFIISAVDTNAARQAIQSQYPARLLQASTHGVRAEVLRCDPTSGGACIRCFADPESDLSDLEARKQFLAMSRGDQEALAHQMGLSIEYATQWAVEGECGHAVDELLRHLRATESGPPAFAVGFVSVMAGTMLAAQTTRELAGLSEPFDGLRCRAVVTLIDPTAITNRVGAFQRDPACPLCRPGSPGMRIWRARFDEPGTASTERLDG